MKYTRGECNAFDRCEVFRVRSWSTPLQLLLVRTSTLSITLVRFHQSKPLRCATSFGARHFFRRAPPAHNLTMAVVAKILAALLLVGVHAWTPLLQSTRPTTQLQALSIDQEKRDFLQLGAALDRGQAHNPTSGPYYEERLQAAKDRIQAFCEANTNNVPTSMDDIVGEWELVLSTVPHGIFRSSPFFLAIQESYEEYAEEKESFGMRKADLFFKLHELQTCSWGVSKIGRVAQHITPKMLYSEFDTSIFSLTVIPILGWFKLLPTFGGCVITAAKAEMKEGGQLDMIVDYTTARKVPGLSGLGEWIWSVRVPVGAIWKLLPWNKGREASCKVFVRYCDGDMRIVEDVSGDYFVYTRPVLPRALDLTDEA